jgi:hypothetical protein
MKLIECDPFQGERKKPKYIRIDKYCYRFSRGGRGSEGKERYWDREMIGRVFPRQGLVSEGDLKELIEECYRP